MEWHFNEGRDQRMRNQLDERALRHIGRILKKVDYNRKDEGYNTMGEHSRMEKYHSIFTRIGTTVFPTILREKVRGVGLDRNKI